MAKFKVYISETVVSETIVEAEDIQEAREKVWEGDHDWTEIDWGNTQIEDVIEVDDNEV